MLGDANNPTASLFGIPIVAAYHLPRCQRCNGVVYLSTGAMRVPEQHTAVVLAVCVSCKTGYKMRLGGRTTGVDSASSPASPGDDHDGETQARPGP